MSENNQLIENVHKLITSEPFQELEHVVKKLSMFSLVGKTHTERWHSAFIAWLLNPSAGHNLGTFPLKRFLMAVRLVAGNEKIPTDFPEIYEIEKFPISNWCIRPDSETKNRNKEKAGHFENKLEGKKKCYFDIALTAEMGVDKPKRTLLLIIENKVKTGESKAKTEEGKDQTEAYAEWANEGYNNKGNNNIFPLDSPQVPNVTYKALVFLTPLNKTPSSKNFMPMSYQHMMDFVLVPCLQNPRISDRGRFLLEEYIGTLSNTGYCLTPQDRRCAKRIMDEYSDTVRNMLRAAERAPDPDEESEKVEQNSLEKYVAALIESKKEVFQLLEWAIKDTIDSNFSLPERYTKTSVSNYDYSILKDELEPDENGLISAYFKTDKNITAAIDFSKGKQPFFYFEEKKSMSANKATHAAINQAEAAGTFTPNKSRSYQWSTVWCVRSDPEYKNKDFLSVYKTISKKLEE